MRIIADEIAAPSAHPAEEPLIRVELLFRRTVDGLKCSAAWSQYKMLNLDNEDKNSLEAIFVREI